MTDDTTSSRSIGLIWDVVHTELLRLRAKQSPQGEAARTLSTDGLSAAARLALQSRLTDDDLAALDKLATVAAKTVDMESSQRASIDELNKAVEARIAEYLAEPPKETHGPGTPETS